MIIVMDIFVIIGLALLGACMGSFAGAQVWRFRARHVDEDRKAGEAYDKAERKQLAPLLGKSVKHDRSQCLSCGHQLRWFDLLPLASWLLLRGKCRYCRQPIGWTEFALEVSLAALYVAMYIFWPGSLAEPLELVKFSVWLIALVPLAINFVYDVRWMVLISYCNWLVIGCGAIFATATVLQAADWVASLLAVVGSVAVLGGLYGVLWLVSRGKWIGDGDIYIGVGLGLLLSDWRLAIVGLFLANFIGTLLVLPGMASGKLERKSRIPFGPLLIAGGLLAWFIGLPVVESYQSLLMY